jgi:DNA polymerase III psi subunit
LAPLAEVAGCTFVSLCPDHAQAADWLHAPPGALTDFAETAALLMNLDLVIAVDTAVAHLAGALGRRVWLLNRHDSCWRWLLGRADSPWYPTLRIFRQPAAGDWAPVVAAVRAALWDQMPAVSTAATSSSRSITSGS